VVAAPDPLLGTAIGRYRVVRVIGQGGMGRVYEGVNPEIGSRVAIKVLAAQFATDPEVSERMFAEARAVNMIRHERIVPAIDLLRLADGRPVLVMELVDGRSMGDVLAGVRAPLGGVVDLILQVLDVLTAAHSVGIVHRDLKPENILITPQGNARVLDFGSRNSCIRRRSTAGLARVPVSYSERRSTWPPSRSAAASRMGASICTRSASSCSRR
jgi:serine/threonine-protein kinase